MDLMCLVVFYRGKKIVMKEKKKRKCRLGSEKLMSKLKTRDPLTGRGPSNELLECS